MKNQFNGSFEGIDQKDSAPASLLALILMILDGPNIEAQGDSQTSHHALSISQLSSYIESYLQHISRINVVWDVYHPSSLREIL